MAAWRSRLKKAHYKTIHAVRAMGPVGRWIYFSFLGDGMRREIRATAAGQRRYFQEESQRTNAYFLRRHVHMIEKGLVMRPRRDTFAVEYIERTVNAFVAFSKDSTTVLSTDERSWVKEVLSRYFDATSASVSPIIGHAREVFVGFIDRGAGTEHGPAAPPTHSAPTVTIEALEQLAERRTSVRWYQDRAVDRTIVDQAIGVALESPTACNRQPYRFYVYDDVDLVRSIAAIPMGTAGYRHAIHAIAVLVGDLSAFPDERDRHLIYIDGCLAAMSFIFALEAQGVSSLCINWPDIASREKAMSDLIGLKPYERVVMLIAYGYADQTGLVPFSQKKPLTDARYYNKTEI